MTHSPAHIIRQMLVDLGIGSDPDLATLGDWPCYDGAEPENPDDVITIYDTTGLQDGRAMFDGELLQHHGVQARIRGQDAPTAWAKADAVQTAFAQTVYDERVTIGANSYFVLCLGKISQVLAVGREPNSRRSVFTINAVAAIRPL